MSRRCCYKDCCSVEEGRKFEDTGLTFFSFPKDTDPKYDLWLQLTQCNPDIKHKLICSKHFDHSKYISTNQRRKMLLSTAIPFQHEETRSDAHFQIDCIDADLLLSKTDSLDDNLEVLIGDGDEDHHYQDEFKAKRAKLEGIHCTTLTVASSTTKTSDMCLEDTIIEEHCNDSDFDIDDADTDTFFPSGQNITTFIYKGEEYIQMPKRDFIADKKEIYKQMKYYKNVFNEMKNLLYKYD